MRSALAYCKRELLACACLCERRVRSFVRKAQGLCGVDIVREDKGASRVAMSDTDVCGKPEETASDDDSHFAGKAKWK